MAKLNSPLWPFGVIHTRLLLFEIVFFLSWHFQTAPQITYIRKVLFKHIYKCITQLLLVNTQVSNPLSMEIH